LALATDGYRECEQRGRKINILSELLDEKKAERSLRQRKHRLLTNKQVVKLREKCKTRADKQRIIREDKERREKKIAGEGSLWKAG